MYLILYLEWIKITSGSGKKMVETNDPGQKQMDCLDYLLYKIKKMEM